MPHLNVNVNGKRYSISGLTRKTCSKQILCALAKVNADIEAGNTWTEPSPASSSDESSSSGVETRKRRQRKDSGGYSRAHVVARKTKKSELRLGERSHETRGRGTNVASKRKRGKAARREDEQIKENGVYSTSMQNLLTLIGAQQSCLLTQQEQLKGKDRAIKRCLNNKMTSELQNEHNCDGTLEEKAEKNLKKIPDECAKDTDHDTGISEQYSDSSYEIHTAACSNESTVVKNGNHIFSPNGAKYVNLASNIFYTADAPKLAMRDARDQAKSCASNPSSPVDFPTLDTRAELSGSDVTDMSDSTVEELSDDDCEGENGIVSREIYKVKGDLASTEAKLAEQSRLIELLTNFTDHGENNSEEQKERIEPGRENLEEEIRNVQKSLRLSVHLYEYQKQEIQANALKLQQVESKICRKRWHVDSLLQELENLKLNPARGRTGFDRNKRRGGALEAGTLV